MSTRTPVREGYIVRDVITHPDQVPPHVREDILRDEIGTLRVQLAEANGKIARFEAQKAVPFKLREFAVKFDKAAHVREFQAALRSQSIASLGLAYLALETEAVQLAAANAALIQRVAELERGQGQNPATPPTPTQTRLSDAEVEALAARFIPSNHTRLSDDEIDAARRRTGI